MFANSLIQKHIIWTEELVSGSSPCSIVVPLDEVDVAEGDQSQRWWTQYDGRYNADTMRWQM